MKTLAITLMMMVCSFALAAQTTSFYDFTVKDIDGNDFKLSSLTGKKVLVVNVASKCGLTPQYANLQKLYEEFNGTGFTIIAFPANNFREQEPGTNSEIKEFCTANYSVTFPMMAKISVTGHDMAPVYRWLTQKSENGVMDAPVTWNFQKFLIDENGKLIKMIPPKESAVPDVVSWVSY